MNKKVTIREAVNYELIQKEKNIHYLGLDLCLKIFYGHL